MNPFTTSRTTDRRSVLILGSRGHFGSAVAQAFGAAGWTVHAHARGGPLDLPLGDAEAWARAVGPVDVLIHALNLPYTRWAQEMLPMAQAGLGIASRLGACFVLPGNVYGFGESMPALLRTDTPEHPSTPKGHLRHQLEHRLRERAAQGQRCVVLRAGDFYGGSPGGWMDRVILKHLARGRLSYPGPLDVSHAWAYLPDLALATVALAEKAVQGVLPAYSAWHFPGHTLTGAQCLAAIGEAARSLGLTQPLQHRRMAWWPLRAAGLVVPMLRELALMRYLWYRPHALDGSALAQLIGPLPSTPPVEALRRCLQPMAKGPAGASVRHPA
jgi:nucleoside-diphosphate-sugar epimerase